MNDKLMYRPTLWKIKGTKMVKVIGWVLGVFAIAAVGMHFDNGEVLAGIISFFAIGFLIPPLLNKINAASKKAAEEKGKPDKPLTQKSANIFGVVLIIIAAFIGSGSNSETEIAAGVQGTSGKEWYVHDIKISYGEMNGKNWESYTSDQKLAISANVLAHFWTEKTLSPNIMNSIQNMDDLKPYAKELTAALDEFYLAGDKQITANQSLSESSVIILKLMKWI
ncbi:hypothetical protein [Pseudoalteromonas nigrifaciens]|uniref:hypothetical protein n=1 Tax=Pseudoalteromonas nigrifaciens TaxID=28109 RepID=UPI0030CA19AC